MVATADAQGDGGRGSPLPGSAGEKRSAKAAREPWVVATADAQGDGGRGSPLPGSAGEKRKAKPARGARGCDDCRCAGQWRRGSPGWWRLQIRRAGICSGEVRPKCSSWLLRRHFPGGRKSIVDFS